MESPSPEKYPYAPRSRPDVLVKQSFFSFLKASFQDHAGQIHKLSTDKVVQQFLETCDAQLHEEDIRELKLICHVKLREKQLRSIPPIEERFIPERLKDAERLDRHFHPRSVSRAIFKLKRLEPQMDPTYHELWYELEAFRFFSGYESPSIQELSILKKDYADWLSGRIRYIFSNTVRLGLAPTVKKCVADTFNSATEENEPVPDEFHLFESDDCVRVSYEPAFDIMFSDLKGLVAKPKVSLETAAIRDIRTGRVDFQVGMLISSVFVDYKRSPEMIICVLDTLLRDIQQRVVHLKQFKEREAFFLSEPSFLTERSLEKAIPEGNDKVSFKDEQEVQSSPVQKSPRGRILTTSAAMLIGKIGGGAEKQQSLARRQSQSDRKLKDENSSLLLSKVRSWKFKNISKKKKQDAIEEHIDFILPALLHLFPKEKKIKAQLIRKLCESVSAAKKTSFEPLVDAKIKNAADIHDWPSDFSTLFEKFCYVECNGLSLAFTESLLGDALIRDTIFNQMLYTDRNCRQLIGVNHTKLSQEKKQLALLNGLFYKIYSAGYHEPKFERPHPKNECKWLAELRARKLISGREESIQQFLYPMLTGSDWAENVFAQIFSFIRAVDIGQKSDETGSRDGDFPGYDIEFSSEKELSSSVVSGKKSFAVEKEYQFELKLKGREFPFAVASVCDHISKQIAQAQGCWIKRKSSSEGESEELVEVDRLDEISDMIKKKKDKWLRKLTITRLSFVEGCPLELAKHTLNLMVESAESNGCLKL